MILNEIKLNIDEDIEKLKKFAAKKSGINYSDIKYFKVLKKSVDARDKSDIKFVYSVEIDNKTYVQKDMEYKQIKTNIKPIICGFGPCGMFAALRLCQYGLKPIIIERGDKIENRKIKVQNFWKKGELDENSNVQFGEGGAGLFSDGKLNTGIKSTYIKDVIDTFIENGAPEEISYLNKPHIGTDNLYNVVKNIRQKILSYGSEIFFNVRLSDIEIKDNKIKKVITADNTFESPVLILAQGHSAADIFNMLYSKNVHVLQKPFSVGLRIEHLQEFLNKVQYGKFCNNKNLPKADYKLSYADKFQNTAYTFCMCPGGFVVASSCAQNSIVTNGMSLYSRDNINCNSAVLVNVDEQDFKSSHPLAGLEYQKNIEKAAFEISDSYNAPCQTFGDFLNNIKTGKFNKILPSYKPGVAGVNLNNLFSERIASVLKNAILDFDKKIKGFSNLNAVLTAPETKSSSPVKISRDEKTLCSVNVKGLYPCGEGSGYAGGIISSAVDGLKTADKIADALLQNIY